jgi:hypothetical protein
MISFPAIPDGEPLTVSATLYRAYLACPEQALGRLRGEYPAESVPGFRGSLAHRIFARHLVAGPIPEQELVQACREEIGTALNPKLEALGLNKTSTPDSSGSPPTDSAPQKSTSRRTSADP